MENLKDRLLKLDEQGLTRGNFKNIQTSQDAKVEINGREILLLGSNNYLGLANDERIVASVSDSIRKYGIGSGGSRLTTGSYESHLELEKRISAFKRKEASLIFNTGYMANVGVISALCDKNWQIFSDKDNHASIVDGALLSGAKVKRYKHSDMNDLEKKLKSFGGEKKLIVTDGVFSMDGDIAPLAEIVALAKKYGCMTMVDDAHAIGVLGVKGRGSASHCGVDGEIDIHIGTLSKAIGNIGGYVSGSKLLIDYLKNTARSFIFSTSLPPALMEGAKKAFDIIENDEEIITDLLEKTEWFKSELEMLGFKLTDSETPIIPIIIGDAQKTNLFSEALMDEGIYVPGIRPPTVPKGTSRLRISLCANHSREDLRHVINVLKKIGKNLGVLI